MYFFAIVLSQYTRVTDRRHPMTKAELCNAIAILRHHTLHMLLHYLAEHQIPLLPFSSRPTVATKLYTEMHPFFS